MKAATPIVLLQGDCREQMKTLPDDSIDAIICDPPYNLAFMGKSWDTHINNAAYQEWTREWATEAFRVLKPGGHLLAFGGTRTYHRQTCGIEDAGFEIRDCLAWIYGTGFPKSLNVSKAIDKAAGAEREVIGTREGGGVIGSENTFAQDAYTVSMGDNGGRTLDITVATTSEAQQWEGWGTALKPAMEPIVVARKPFKGTVAANVLEYGTGALNIDASRIATDERWQGRQLSDAEDGATWGGALNRRSSSSHNLGRWPANILFDEDAVAVLDEQSGGASRFFYVAKAGKKERNAGLDNFDEQRMEHSARITPQDNPRQRSMSYNKNTHPCVKPIQLLRYLSKLVTPPGGTILDPFMGSGSGGCAAVLEGFNYIGMEMEPEYLGIAKARIEHWQSSSE
jgi:DNA modification methylase